MLFEHAAAQLQWSAFGRHFGYPDCCIWEFNTSHCQATKDQFPDGPWRGTGFLPCQVCAPAAQQDFAAFVAKHIEPRRSHARDFPREELEEEDIDALIEQALAEAGWLQRVKISIFRFCCDAQVWWDDTLHPRRP